MNYDLIRDIINLAEEFELDNSSTNRYTDNLDGFKNWMAHQLQSEYSIIETNWEGKESGRSPESVISTLIVHMNRYAKNYGKAALLGTDFSTIEELAYLINLKAFGEMSKTDLIRKNVQEKPAGMQVINRLIAQGWVIQQDSATDKRSKILAITDKGNEEVEKCMDKIRVASRIITGNLSHAEKMELIRLLNKLNDFHLPIYNRQIETEFLLNEALKNTDK